MSHVLILIPQDIIMLLFLFLLGLTLGAVSPSDDPLVKLQRGSCRPFWFSFNNRCYKYIATDMDWSDAEFNCVSEGANLVSIHSQGEENFVKSLIKNFDPAEGYTWIGLSDTQKDGRWMWSDGCAVKFFTWSSGEPSNYGGYEDCVHTNYGDGDIIMLVFLFLLGLALGAVSPSEELVVEPQQNSCPMFWTLFNGRCYNQEEENFVKTLIKSFDPAEGYTWIGLSDVHKEGRWMWSDGSAAKFFFWDAGQPDNHRGLEDCGHTNFGSVNKWNDFPCSNTHSSVCASRITC
ncbi:hypothetical protein F7725_024981, partial [Dissostichus mawsoni]